jgi:predicted nuclease of restriction endonuclease-like (RecB) superfamily
MSEVNDFQQLVFSIRDTHRKAQDAALQAVNTALTMRNWMVGHHILGYEQHGLDRAQYGVRLLERLAERLRSELDRSYTGRYLGLCRQLCTTYPDIPKSLISEFGSWIPKSLISESPGVNVASADSLVDHLLRRLSFTHFVELMKCSDPQQRSFYALEAMRGAWSVRELKRQIGSLYFERSAYSKDKSALSRLAHQTAEAQSPTQLIRDPYVFEFLGLQPTEVMREADLETALMDRLQAFLLELGHGFCFEARQKRLLIGGEHFFVDIVFYHRILKCHVLVELKADRFRHEHLGQLNSYVAWYRENQMVEGDQPPIGILLCTAKNDELVHYALAGLSDNLFVSRYQLELPDQKDMESFMVQAIKELGGGE